VIVRAFLRSLDEQIAAHLHPIRDQFTSELRMAAVRAAIAFAHANPAAPLRQSEDAELAAPESQVLSDEDIERLADAAADSTVQRLRRERSVDRAAALLVKMQATDGVVEWTHVRDAFAEAAVDAVWSLSRESNGFEDAFTEAEAAVRHVFDETGLTDEQLDGSEYLETIHRHVDGVRRKARRRLLRAMRMAVADILDIGQLPPRKRVRR
jgi:hypothetical protein